MYTRYGSERLKIKRMNKGELAMQAYQSKSRDYNLNSKQSGT